MDIFYRRIDTWFGVVDGDIWFNPDVWPAGMLHHWRCSTLGYTHRCYIASFAYLNGFDVENLIDCLYVLNVAMTLIKERKIRDLYRYWDSYSFGYLRREKYFTYCFYHNRICNLNHNLYRLRNHVRADVPVRFRGGNRVRGGGRGRRPQFHC